MVTLCNHGHGNPYPVYHGNQVITNITRGAAVRVCQVRAGEDQLERVWDWFCDGICICDVIWFCKLLALHHPDPSDCSVKRTSEQCVRAFCVR